MEASSPAVTGLARAIGVITASGRDLELTRPAQPPRPVGLLQLRLPAAGDDGVFKAVCAQAGAIVADDLESKSFMKAWPGWRAGTVGGLAGRPTNNVVGFDRR